MPLLRRRARSEGLGGIGVRDDGGLPQTSESAPEAPKLVPASQLPATPPKGLSSSEVRGRQGREGFNEIPERRVSLWRRLASYLWGPIPWMIEVAAVLAAVLQNWDDFAIILTLLIVNATVGFWEEYQSGNAVAALKAHLAPQARVLRDTVWNSLPARELVPGDIIRLRMGDIVPADVHLLADASLELDQSALTGESLTVSRSSGETALSGSIVRRGEGTATVTSIGPKTFLGRTAQLVASAQPVSHLQRAILRIGDTLIVLALGLAVVIEAVSVARGVNLLTSVQFALVLAVAAIPVAMPTVLSVTMAVGARTLADEKAIVTRLEAMEELAGIDVLCSDKTGTLTQNALRMGSPVAFEGVTADEVLEAAVLASRVDDHDPIDDAILSSPGALALAGKHRVTRFLPFDPVLKRTEASLVAPDGSTLRVTKGAPQAILSVASGAANVPAALDTAVSEIARHGYRALGVARARGNGPWEFLGVIPLFDPLRPDSAEVLAEIRALGVQVKMVTGDQAAIARETGHQLGMEGAVTTPDEWNGSAGEARRAQVFEETSVFAQVFPEHKYEIVDQLQRHGHIVGMTGDGVNDAPALKKADAGIAVSGASDAARSAAAVVLTAPGLGVILTAIRQARQTFARMSVVRHLPDRGDDPTAPVHHPHDRHPWVLSCYSARNRPHCPAQRRRDPRHRVRPHSDLPDAGFLEDGPDPSGLLRARNHRGRVYVPVVGDRGRSPSHLRRSSADTILSQTLGRWTFRHLPDPHRGTVLEIATGQHTALERHRDPGLRLPPRPDGLAYPTRSSIVGGRHLGVCGGRDPPSGPS